MQSTRLEDPQLATALPEEGTGENDDKTLSPVKLSTRPGAKTSDFYSVKSIPERFNHPGTQSYTCIWCEILCLFHTTDWFEGYTTKPQHPFFSPSSSVYG